MGLRSGAGAGAVFAVAAESAFGCYDATDYREIDLSGLTWYFPLVSRADVGRFTSAMKMRTYQRALVTARGGESPPEVLAVTDGSAEVKRQLSGEFDLTFPWAWLGSTLPSASALGVIFASALRYIAAAAASSSVLTTPSSTTFTVGGGDYGNFTPGDMIGVTVAGRTTWHRVTSKSGGDTIKTMTPHGMTGASTVYHAHLYLAPPDGAPTGPSFAVGMIDRDEGYEVVATGCRLKAITFTRTGDDGSSLDVTCRIEASDGYYLEGSQSGDITLTEPSIWGVGGSFAKVLNAPVTISQDHAASSVPFGGTSAELKTRTWGAAVEIMMDRRGGGQAYRNGKADMDCTGHKCTLDLTADPSTTLSPRDMLADAEQRAVTLNIGGLSTRGGCIHVPRAAVTEDPGIDIDEERKSHQVKLEDAPYAGDTASTADQTNAPWCIAIRKAA
jgi:hypothetical protein